MFGLLICTAAFNDFYPPYPGSKQVSKIEEEPCTVPGPDTFNITCRPGAIAYLISHDEDGNGTPDSAYAILYPDFLVDPVLSNYPDDAYFSVNREGEEPDSETVSLLLSCSDTGTVAVEVYAWRQDSILASCFAEILVRELVESCGAPYPVGICGYFTHYEDYGFPQVYDVQVFLSGDTTATAVTDSNGVFRFLGLEEGNSYLVAPYKNTDHSYNVSLFDIVLISKHVLGVQPLGSPYKLIAADVNNSGSVTNLDIVALRRLLLGEATGFPNNASWRFIDRPYVFPDPENPWLEPFPEEMLLPARVLYGMALCNEFRAIKVGDVNGN